MASSKPTNTMAPRLSNSHHSSPHHRLLLHRFPTQPTCRFPSRSQNHKCPRQICLECTERRPIGPSQAGAKVALSFAVIADVPVQFGQCRAMGMYKRAEHTVDFVVIHGAHGYPFHSCLSRLSNTRSDAYEGQSFENHTRFLLHVVKAVRALGREGLFVRLSASDWPGGPRKGPILEGAAYQQCVDRTRIGVSEDIPMSASDA